MHVAVITETWWNDDRVDEETVSSNFNVFRRGSVAVITKSAGDVVVLEEIEGRKCLFLKLNT